jgi:kynurenine formamidase
VRFQEVLSYEIDGAKLTGISMTAHTGTHLDAPLHVMGPDAGSIDAFGVDYFLGDAALLDIPRGKNEPITGADLEKAGGHARDGDIVLIRTGWLEKTFGEEAFEESLKNSDSSSA